MKQFFFSLTVIFFASTAHAQLNKGQWLVGGNAGFSSESNKAGSGQNTYSFKFSNLTVSPAIGYFIYDKLAVGLRPGINVYNDKLRSDDSGPGYENHHYNESRSTGLDITPFVRYYFLKKKNKINLLADISYSYRNTTSHGKNSSSYIDDLGAPHTDFTTYSDKYTEHGFFFSAGPVIFLNSRAALEILGGVSNINESDSRPAQRGLLVTAGFQIYLGK